METTITLVKEFRTYLAGQGDLVSRSIAPITLDPKP